MHPKFIKKKKIYNIENEFQDSPSNSDTYGIVNSKNVRQMIKFNVEASLETEETIEPKLCRTNHNFTCKQGTVGNTGDRGDKGAKGQTGNTGHTGDTGFSGLGGATGSQGSTGQRGTQITASEGPPSEFGNELKGDLYIDADNGDLYQFDEWLIIGNLKGDTGSTGPQGSAGSGGLTGSTGLMGPIGSTGPAGLTGIIGQTGLVGPNGSLGATGAAGSIGPIGITGIAGLNGPTGATGATGATGFQGITGLTGPSGGAGPSGAPGIGPTGETGSTGIIGPTGPTSTCCVSVDCEGPTSIFTLVSGRIETVGPTVQSGPGWYAVIGAPTPNSVSISFNNPSDLSEVPVIVTGESPILGGLANITNRNGNNIIISWTPTVNFVDFILAGCVEQIPPPPPTSMLARCTEPTTIYTLTTADPNDPAPLASGAIIPPGAQRVAITLHSYATTALSTLPIARYLKTFHTNNIPANPLLFDAVLAFQYDTINQDFTFSAQIFANIINNIISDNPGLRLTIVGWSLGGIVARYGIEQVGVGQFTDNFIELVSINHCVPPPAADIAIAIGIAATASHGQICPAALNPNLILLLFPCITDSNSDPSPINSILNGPPSSPWASTIRYFTLAGNQYNDPPDVFFSSVGGPLDLYYKAFYPPPYPTPDPILGPITDGLASIFNSWGIDPRPFPIGGGDVLAPRSDFLASFGATVPNFVRRLVPHNHLTAVGLFSTGPVLMTSPGGLPLDVQAVMNSWLAISL